MCTITTQYQNIRWQTLSHPGVISIGFNALKNAKEESRDGPYLINLKHLMHTSESGQGI